MKVIGEIQMLKQLSEAKENMFTTKLVDIITAKDKSKLNFVFLVLEYIESDLKKVL